MGETDDSRPPPTSGTPESAAWFRAEIDALGMTQTGFAKWLKRRGDDRKDATILRHVQRMANGEARVSGEMRVILSMMRAGAKGKARKPGGQTAGAPSGSDLAPAGSPAERAAG
jgi:hypothetical protein